MGGEPERAWGPATVNDMGRALVYGEDLRYAELRLSEAIDDADHRGGVPAAAVARVWRAQARLRSGRLAQARADAEAALDARDLAGPLAGPCRAIVAEAALEQGDVDAARAAVRAAEESVDVTRQALVLMARARLALADGDAGGAVADVTCAHRFMVDVHGVDNPVVAPWRTELARAKSRLGDGTEAIGLALQEAELARSVGSTRAEGIALAVAGAIAGSAETLREAAGLLESTPAALEHARALVDLGATLRRTRERAAGRSALRRGLTVATRLGAEPLAQRARDELGGGERLTPTEHRIAELAAQGLSNRRIAESLVVAPKTVEWHLSRIYAKLGVAGRRDLDRALLG